MPRKLFLLFTLVFLLYGISSVSVLSQTPNPRLERQIRREILTLPFYDVFDIIGFAINGDTVTLTGYVTRPTTSRGAEASVADLEGVAKVINNIEVLPLSPSDDRIRRRVLQTLVNRGGSLYRYFLGTNSSIR